MAGKADDFEAEVQALRRSTRFQAFLDKRMADTTWIPLGKVEKEIAADLENHKSARASTPRGRKSRSTPR